MKTIAEIRRDNLARLIKEFGTLEKVAELGETSPVYLSQIKNRTIDPKTKKSREMGSALARKLEKGKVVGWMDTPERTAFERQDYEAVNRDDDEDGEQAPAAPTRRITPMGEAVGALFDLIPEDQTDRRRAVMKALSQLIQECGEQLPASAALKPDQRKP